jgi:hypothetical protein
MHSVELAQNNTPASMCWPGIGEFGDNCIANSDN